MTKPGRGNGGSVFFLAALAFGAATVPLTGGRLGAMGELRLRWGPVLLAAVALQGVILVAIPHHLPGVHEPLHLLSYVLLGTFVAVNMHVRGMRSIALGGLCNAAVITANGGVMPVSRSALERAGIYPLPDRWLNANVLDNPRLSPLGDMFPIPVLHTVVSVGDILVAVGAILLIHGVCGSRVFPFLGRTLWNACKGAASWGRNKTRAILRRPRASN